MQGIESHLTALLAYVGPGAGLSAIGAFLAVVAGVLVALFGFVWYPVKRLLNRKRDAQPASPAEPAE
jgi:hypothetical protein